MGDQYIDRCRLGQGGTKKDTWYIPGEDDSEGENNAFQVQQESRHTTADSRLGSATTCVQKAGLRASPRRASPDKLYSQ